MASANIFSQYLQQPRSVLDYSADLDAADSRQAQLAAQRGQNALQALTLQQTQGQMADATAKRNAIQQIYAGLPATADPLARARAMQANPLTAADGVAAEQAILNNQRTAASTAKDSADADSRTFSTQQERQKAAIQKVAAFTDPGHAAQDLQAAVQRGEIPQPLAEAIARSIPQDPAQFDQWKLRAIVGLTDPAKMAELLKPVLQTRNTGGTTDTLAIDPITGKVTVTNSVKNTQSPDSVAATGLGFARLSEDKRHNAASEDAAGEALSKPFEVTGSDGNPVLVRQDKQGNITPVDGYAPKKAALKDIPATVNAKIIEGQQSLTNIDKAIEAVQANPGAFGLVNAIPGVERMRQGDTPGVDARAQVANIGSLKIHDRSGAAVSASEFPRLAPFIPSSSDNPTAIVQKLKQMKQIAESELGLFADTYNEDAGYRPNSVLKRSAQPASPGITIDPSAIAAELKRRGH